MRTTLCFLFYLFAGYSNMSQGGERGNPPPSALPFDVKLLAEALEAKFKKMLDDALEPIYSELSRNKGSPDTPHSSRGKSKIAESDSSNDEEDFIRCPKPKPRTREETSDPFKGIKMKIPEFKGRLDPEAYLDWESKVEMIFACQN